MPDLKKKRNILHLVIFILACLAGLAIADVACYDCFGHYIQNQFIDATIYGYLIVAFLLLGAILFDEDIPDKTLYLLCAGGALLYLITTICLLVNAYNTYYGGGGYEGYGYGYGAYDDGRYYKLRTICAGVICLILSIIYLAELVISLIKKDVIE